MADYIYLLETRLSKAHTTALSTMRSIARAHELTVFLVGGAVRDLISGAPVRDLDVVVQGNALKLKRDIEKAGGEISAEAAEMQILHVRFPSGVRIEVGSTVTTTYSKPGRVVAEAATILEDLRRRDFTANAMALSLNEGSYGLLMDPLNGVADIENRELRLVSNYGFLEDPVRLIRAARLMARLGWRLDERSQARYDAAKEQNYIAALQPADQAYEMEELFHEEDPVRVMRRLEEDGWLAHLNPLLSVSKVNVPELTRLRDVQMRLLEQGILADASAANFPLLTAKLSARDVTSLREGFPRKAFSHEIESLDGAAKTLAGQLVAKSAALPSQSYELIMNAPPAVVLWVAYSTRNAALQAKFESFYTDWPQARQRIPHLLMQEMRISSELPQYTELLERLSLSLMDGVLDTPEAMRAFLEPYSPPAPPPPVSVRRPRAAKAVKKEVRSSKTKKAATVADAGQSVEVSSNGEAKMAAEASPSLPGTVVQVPRVDSPAAAGSASDRPGRRDSRSEASAPTRAARTKPPVTAPSAKQVQAAPRSVAKGVSPSAQRAAMPAKAKSHGSKTKLNPQPVAGKHGKSQPAKKTAATRRDATETSSKVKAKTTARPSSSRTAVKAKSAKKPTASKTARTMVKKLSPVRKNSSAKQTKSLPRPAAKGKPHGSAAKR